MRSRKLDKPEELIPGDFFLHSHSPGHVAIVLDVAEKPGGDPNHYLSDGAVTLAVMPWQIGDFEGSGIERPAPDHIGFKVESMAAFKADLQKFAGQYTSSQDDRPEKNPEREVRQKLFAKCCFGQYQMSDPDGVLIDVAEG